jgi:Zn-dependent protease
VFGKKITLFRLFGFEVGVDPTWIILAILVAWSLSTGYFPFYYRDLSTETYWIMGIIGAAGLFLSIIFHEFSHSLVARRSGMSMKGITLFIFGGVAEMSEEPPGAREEFWMALAGPVSSFIAAGVFYGFEYIGNVVGWPVHITAVVGYLALINFILAVFNLIPAYPLDGGRILRSILWGWKKNVRWATRVSSQIGEGFGIALVILGVFRVLTGYFIGGMWLFLIGMFIRGAARASYQQLLTRRVLEGEPVSRFMNEKPITVPTTITLDKLVEEYVYRHHHKLYPVVEGDKLVGCITTRQVKAIAREDWPSTTAAQIALDCSADNTVSPETDAVDALAAMQRNSSSRMMVVSGGRLKGIISLKDLLDFLSMKIEFER